MKIRIAYLNGERLKAEMVTHTLRKMLPDCKVKPSSASDRSIAHIYIETPKPKE